MEEIIAINGIGYMPATPEKWMPIIFLKYYMQLNWKQN